MQGRGQTIIYLRPYEELARAPASAGFLLSTATRFLSTATARQSGLSRAHQRSVDPDGILQEGDAHRQLLLGRWSEFCGPACDPALPLLITSRFWLREDNAQATLIVRPIKPLKIENTYLFERLRARRRRVSGSAGAIPGAGRGIFNDHILRSKWNWQFTPQLSVRVILQYNALLAGTPGVGSPYTYLPTSTPVQRRLPDHVPRASRHRDLRRLQQRPAESERGSGNSRIAGYVTNTARGYLNDSRQFFVKVSYLFRF